MATTNKRKIFNDPVYDGFLAIDDEVIFDVIEHPFFQRQRRIKQLGLSFLVYPGAMHTRFSHMLGALNLMCRALEVLKMKGVPITDEECRGAKLAILLHDIGHGPFSHTTEHIILDLPHEEITLRMMERINKDLDGSLDMAIEIFKNTYPKHFLHQLVSSQLDMDRLDYLGRDSFFTGVSEGIVGTDRIISMLNVKDDELVVDQKGIYSIEKFIISRRLMYWQVYMHKTVIAADVLLLNIIRRARELDPKVLNIDVDSEDYLERFASIDDDDVMVWVKKGRHHEDAIMRRLCSDLVDRHLPSIRFGNSPFNIEQVRREYPDLDDYSVGVGELHNHAYDFSDHEITIMSKDGVCMDISRASDQLDRHFLEKQVTKYYMYYPKQR